MEIFASPRNAEARRVAAVAMFWEPADMAVIAGIRCAEPLERGALGELHGRSSWVWAEDRVVLEAHPDALGGRARRDRQRGVRVAVGNGGELLGFSVAAEGGRGVCELDDLFVDPEMLRRGVGRVLVEDAAVHATATGGQQVTVVAHPRNFPFYEVWGSLPANMCNRGSGRRYGCGENSREAAIS
jgi:GNAT superfamily N-acetyltransferase